MRIGLKVGSALLADEGFILSGINERFLLNFCRQVALLSEDGHQIFLVTSGAVACDSNRKHSRALRAAIGQGRLIGRYMDFLRIFSIEAAQMLLTAFELKDNQEHICRLFEEAFENEVVPVVNANDAVNSTELDRLKDFADNDVLFTELCLLLGADLAIFATDSRGLIDEDGDGSIVNVIDERNYTAALEMARDSSSHGYGNKGMLTKLECGKRLSETGDIKAIIANGRLDDFALKAVNELLKPRGNFGTVFRFNPILL